MVVPEGHFDGAMTITAIGFRRADMASSSVILHGLKISLGPAGGEELGPEFAMNLPEDAGLTPVLSGSAFTAADDGSGNVLFELDTEYEHDGGHLLLDISYSDIDGNMYVWSWDSGGNTMLSASGLAADRGFPHSFPPMLIIQGR